MSKGEAHYSAKLTEDDVRMILRDTVTPTLDLAAMFGVGQANIQRIKRREIWRRVRI